MDDCILMNLKWRRAKLEVPCQIVINHYELLPRTDTKNINLHITR